MEQLANNHVKFKVDEDINHKEALRLTERARASAVQAFIWLDSNETLRRCLSTKSRPPKLETISEGVTVYVYDPPAKRKGQARRLRDNNISWTGPCVVVCVERRHEVPNRVWVRLRSKLKCFPLQKIRTATPDEMLGAQWNSAGHGR